MGRSSIWTKVFWGILLFTFWISVYEEILITEVIVSLFVIAFTLYFVQKLYPEPGKERKAGCANLKCVIYYFVYLIYILKDILVANFHVAKIVLSPRMRIRPKLLIYNHGFNKDFIRFMYANSITLTPGTLTIEMDNDHVTVHLLERENETNLVNWKVGKLLSNLERCL